MAICDLCCSVPYRRLPSPPSTSSWSQVGDTDNLAFYFNEEDLSEKLPIGFPYHQDIDSLAASAHDCELCRLIYSQVTLWTDRYNKAYNLEGEKGYLRHDVETWGINNYPHGQQLWITSRYGGSDGFIVLTEEPRRKIDAKNRTVYYLMAGAVFCVEPESPLASSFSLRPIQEDSASTASFDVAETWLKECLSSHRRCRSGPTALPSRILDVGTVGDSVVKLLSPDGAKGEYTSLSHCWGPGSHFRTTSENIHRHMSGVEVDHLPKTFQDAIIINRRLGFRYLWIDSLCICQDDEADWARESSRMSEVYSNAVLVIAANHASQNDEGCFNTRDNGRIKDVRLPLDEKGSVVVNAYPIRPKREEPEKVSVELDGEPLSKRGWALQERYLARRVLHYCSDQMFFECNHGVLGEDGFRSDERFCNAYSMIDPAADADHDKNSLNSNALARWHDLIWQYGKRATTKRVDKFPALSGLAKLFGRRMGAEYVVGLWSNALTEGLAWQSYSRPEIYEGAGQGEPDDLYIAPSWSWASTDGIAATGLKPGWRNIAVVENFHYDLKTSNPYGEVSSGWIELTAPVIPAKFSVKTQWKEDEVKKRRPLFTLQTPTSGAEEINAPADHPRRFAHELSQVEGIVLLVLGYYPKHDSELDLTQARSEGSRERDLYFCLVLISSSKQSGAMRRVGWCFAGYPHIAEALEQYKKKVTLV